MSHTIELTKNHKRVLLEALYESQTVKYNKLRKPESIDRMILEYNKAAQKLLKPVECGKVGSKAGDNLFGWLKDQFHHSGKLPDTEFGKLAINICEAAGNNSYEAYCRMTIMNTLFE